MGYTLKRLCTICARGGSRGLPGKNIRVVAGLPLIAHSVVRALETGLFDALAVSSDDPAILEAAAQAGASILVQRPNEMATDRAPKIPAIRHCVTDVEAQMGLVFDQIVDLDATSPLRTTGDIIAVIDMLAKVDTSNVITGSPARRSPYFNLVEVTAEGRPALSKTLDINVVRRQDAPQCFDMNASIYAWHRAELFKMDSVFGPHTRLFEMPEERSVDVDSPLDFEIVAMLMAAQQKE